MSKLEPAVIVIFGVSGDLSRRKVLPAIYHLIKDNLLPDKIFIFGTSRQNLSTDDLMKEVELCVLEEEKVCDPEALKKFKDVFEIIQFDPVQPDHFADLKKRLEDIEDKEGVCLNRLYYLSIPPQVYAPVIKNLGNNGLTKSCAHGNAKIRLLVEKPFGYDLVSATELIENTSKYFSEEQIYRIDHYLAKETAQNILTFRKFNPLFNKTWNNHYISSIYIRALEKLTIEGRVFFYDNVGALRDLVQSHLLQLLALTAMDLPDDIFSSEQNHSGRLRILESIKISHEQLEDKLIRGQYEGYQEEVKNPGSETETYVKLELSIDSEKWHRVPITIETGKALTDKKTDIRVDFKGEDGQINQLTIRIQPNEGIDIGLVVKRPGLDKTTQNVVMDFSYSNSFDNHGHPDAYERVLTDALMGDQSLFASSEEVLAAWKVVQQVLDFWQNQDPPLHSYEVGSSGPVIE